MKKTFALLMIVTLLAAPAMAFAGSPWTEASSYSDKVTQKLDFGAKNALVGWADLFYEPIKAHDEGTSMMNGIAKGIWDAICNEVGGLFHLATFLIPVDITLPDNGVQFS